MTRQLSKWSSTKTQTTSWRSQNLPATISALNWNCTSNNGTGHRRTEARSRMWTGRTIVNVWWSSEYCALTKLGNSQTERPSQFWNIGVEGPRIIKSKKALIMVDTLSEAEIWNLVEEALIRDLNTVFDKPVFLLTKRLWGKTLEHFYGKLKELAKKCDFENKEELLIGDLFITNQMDPQIQNKLLKQKVEHRKDLQLATIIELGMWN